MLVNLAASFFKKAASSISAFPKSPAESSNIAPPRNPPVPPKSDPAPVLPVASPSLPFCPSSILPRSKLLICSTLKASLVLADSSPACESRSFVKLVNALLAPFKDVTNPTAAPVAPPIAAPNGPNSAPIPAPTPAPCSVPPPTENDLPELSPFASLCCPSSAKNDPAAVAIRLPAKAR